MPALDTADSTFPVITLAGSSAAPRRRGVVRNFLDAFKSTSQATTNTSNADSFNSTTSNVTSNSVGDSSISIGAANGGANDTVALVVGAIALLGALYIFFTRK